jgi:hypothetical protein
MDQRGKIRKSFLDYHTSTIEPSVVCYFALALNCSFPVVTSVCTLWPAPFQIPPPLLSDVRLKLNYLLLRELTARTLSANWFAILTALGEDVLYHGPENLPLLTDLADFDSKFDESRWYRTFPRGIYNSKGLYTRGGVAISCRTFSVDWNAMELRLFLNNNERACVEFHYDYDLWIRIKDNWCAAKVFQVTFPFYEEILRGVVDTFWGITQDCISNKRDHLNQLTNIFTGLPEVLPIPSTPKRAHKRKLQ